MKVLFRFTFLIFVLNALAFAQTLRIEIDELSKDLSKYKIVDTRSSTEFKTQHIKNALNFPVSKSYENLSFDGKIVTPNKMQKIIRDLGININDKVVIYDNGEIFDAARLFWTFEVYGFKDVKLLNGGFQGWINKNLPISDEIKEVKKSKYIASINSKRLSTKFTTQIATRNPNQVIIDARPYNSYIGKESVAKRFGHIPKALHIPAVHNLNKEEQETKLKNTKELSSLYKDIKKDKKVVIYCAVGRIAATNYFALRELGYDVSNYDASWKEWGNDSSLPITNKSKTSSKTN